MNMEEKITKLLNSFKNRGIEGHYFKNVAQVKEYLYSSLEKNASIGFGGSMTFEKETALYEELKNNSKYKLIDRYNKDESIEEINSKMINCDYFFMSSNAISLDGQLVNIDGRGSRLAYLLYGPKNVIIIAGVNKIEEDLHKAIYRARNVAAPKNAVRLHRNTPCASQGRCYDCLSPDCICANIVITRRSHIPNRIKVLLVDEELGY